MKDYRVTVKVRNNRILKAIEAVGGVPGGKWCEENNLKYASVNALINMKASPIDNYGRLTQDAEALCGALNQRPEDLWSNEQIHPLERNFSEMEMDHEQILNLTGNSVALMGPDDVAESKELASLMAEGLASLTVREQQVLHLRFHEDMTYEEIGKRLGVIGQRAYQIESHALRKMRQPRRSGLIIDYSDSFTDKEQVASYKRVAMKYRLEKNKNET